MKKIRERYEKHLKTEKILSIDMYVSKILIILWIICIRKSGILLVSYPLAFSYGVADLSTSFAIFAEDDATTCLGHGVAFFLHKNLRYFNIASAWIILYNIVIHFT